MIVARSHSQPATSHPPAETFTGTLRRDCPVYFATGNRGNTPKQACAHIHSCKAFHKDFIAKNRTFGNGSEPKAKPPSVPTPGSGIDP
jgi:hypothetical protein